MSIDGSEDTRKTPGDFYSKAFSRNIGLLSKKEQDTLKKSKIAIAGLGGVGGNYCLSMVRTGLGNFSIADFDSFEVANINRQAGAEVDTFGRAKCEVMAEKILAVNPHAEVEKFSKGINEDNMDEFLQEVDVVLDGLDFFAIKERLLLFRKAREKGIFAITSPPVGFGAALLVFDPKGMSFEDYFDIQAGMEEKEMLFRFGIGLTPSFIQRAYFRPDSIDLSGKKTPSLSIGTQMCSALVSCEVVKIVLDKKIRAVPCSTHFDPYVQKYRKIYLPWGNRNPKQLFKRWVIKKILKNSGKI